MKKFKKLLAVILCASLIFGVSVPAASAATVQKPACTTSDFDLSIKGFVNQYETHGAGAAFYHSFANTLSALAQVILKVICCLTPVYDWENIKNYTPEKENILLGRDTYRKAPADGAEWSLGYSSASIIPDDFEAGKYYIGNSASVTSKNSPNLKKGPKAQGVLDDQRIRVAAIDDNSGDGLAVLAVIDGLGVGSGTIRAIREKVLASAEKNGTKISSINISATHCHSALDTQGVSTSLLGLAAGGLFRLPFVTEKINEPTNHFKENLINVAAKAIDEAIADMKTGELYYDTADVSEYYHDKRDVVENVPDAAILRFEPSDGSKETYIANITCHPTTTGVKGNGCVSSDYIYYMDQNFINDGYNFLFLQGAVGQLSQSGNGIADEYKMTADDVKNAITKCKDKDGNALDWSEIFDDDGAPVYGDFTETLALANEFTDAVKGAAADGEEKLAPVINNHYGEINITTSNYLLNWACRLKLVDNVVYRTGFGVNDVCLPSEVGYLELGHRMAFGLFPAELYPEVFHSGGTDEKTSWSGEKWAYESMTDECAKFNDPIDIHCICFANDYIGYVVPDNYYSLLGVNLLHSNMFEETEIAKNNTWGNSFGDDADELLSAGKTTASGLVECFLQMVEEYTK